MWRDRIVKSRTIARAVILLVAVLIWLSCVEVTPISLDQIYASSTSDASPKRSSSAIAITADGSTCWSSTPTPTPSRW